MDIAEWLEGLGLRQYSAAFAAEGVDLSVVASLSDQDLKDIGVALLGHRRKILAAAREIGEATPAPAVSASPSTAPAPQRDDAERRPLTVMFCDLVGSTGLAAKLDAEDWREIVGAYLDEASKAVTGHGGHVLKKLGDGLMALFGYPRAQENDAERAARAGLAILRALEELNTRSAAKGLPALAARIGLESGPVVVDATGEVFGEAPNVAARVQGAAEPGTLFVTAGVQRQVAGLFVAEDKGPHELNGVAGKPVLYRLVRASGGGRRIGARSLTPFVGREEELALILRRWERARSGDGQFVQIVGEPGLGKSRLMEEFRRAAAETPHTWVGWTSSQLLQNTPLHPLAEWGRQRFGGAEIAARKRLAELEAALAQVRLDPAEYAPLLAPLLDIPTSEAAESKLAPEELRRRRLAALVAWVLAGARAQPIVLAFEDLHWADPTTIDLMKTLADRGATAPLFVLATARPEFRPTWSARSHHGMVSLVPLDRGQIRDMIASIAEQHALSKELIEVVSERSGGVPLFVEEVTRLLLERGEGARGHEIPPTLQQSLAARLDRLGEGREVAQVGAVLGREFPHALLAAVAGLPPAALTVGLDRLAEADLLFVEEIAPDLSYRFKHALIQDAAYESLLKSRRQALHRRAAQALAASAQSLPDLVAHHFTEAGETELAIEWWGKAGDAALKRSAFQEAISHLGNAIEMADKAAGQGPRREEAAAAAAAGQRMKLQGQYVQAVSWARGFAAEETTAALAQTGELATGNDVADAPFETYYARFINHLFRGALTSARETAEKVLRVAESMAEPTEAAAAHRILAVTCVLQGDFAEARTQCEHTLRIYDPERDREAKFRFGIDSRATATAYLAVADWHLGEVSRASERIAEAMTHAVDCAHVPTLAAVYFDEAWLALLRDDAAAALQGGEALVSLSREHGLPLFVAIGELFSAAARAKLGGRASGSAEFRQALTDYAGSGAKLGLSFFWGLLAEIEANGGDAEAALAAIDEALALAAETGEHGSDASCHRTRGEILLERNPADPAAAEAAFLAAIAVAREQGARTFELLAALPLAKLLQTNNRPLEAHDVLAPALEGFSPTPLLPAIAEAQALLDLLEGSEAVRARRRDQHIRTQYAKALMIGEGYTASTTEAAFRRVEASAASRDGDAVWTQFFGRWTQAVFRGDLAQAAAVAEEQVNFAATAGVTAMSAAGHRMLCTTRILQGSYDEARRHGEEAVANYDESAAASYRTATGADFKVGADIFLAIACWATGDFELAADLRQKAIGRAEAVDPIYSLVMALTQTLFPLAFARLPGPALKVAERALQIAIEHKIGAWELHLKLYHAWAAGRLGEPSGGAAELHSVWSAMQERELHAYDAMALALLADLAFARGAAEEALDFIARAIDAATTTGSGADLAGLLRSRGEILAGRDAAASEQAFRESIAVARRQGGRAFEVMSALPLARLLHSTGRSLEAHEVLAAALEGLAPTPELPAITEAQALVHQIAAELPVQHVTGA